MTIFEDDIYLGKNADNFLTDGRWILDKLIDIDIIELETAFEKFHLDKAVISYNGQSLSSKELSYRNSCLHYLEKSSHDLYSACSIFECN